MKKTLTGSIIMLLISCSLSAQREGPITVEKKGLKKNYYRSGEPIEFKELALLLKSNPVSSGEFGSYRTNSIIGASSIGVGTAFIVVGFIYTVKSAQAVNDNNLQGTTDYQAKSTTNLLLGAGFYVISIPFNLLARSHFVKSLDLYNSSFQSGSLKPDTSFYFGLTGDGIGIGLRF